MLRRSGEINPLIRSLFDPYASTSQSTNLRVIESALTPTYQAKNDTLELNADYNVTPALTFSSQTGYNKDFLWSAEDYNRFNTQPGIFTYYPQSAQGYTWQSDAVQPDPSGQGHCAGPAGSTEAINGPQAGSCNGLIPGTPCRPSVADESTVCYVDAVFKDPQLGTSDRLVAEDLSDEHAWQFNQEFRLASDFKGPFNFSIGGNFLHYETEENYYVFIDTLTNTAAVTYAHGVGESAEWDPGVSDNSQCSPGGFSNVDPFVPHSPFDGCVYIDPNPIKSLNNEGHNYFLSQNPYVLNSYAGFGEAYYQVLPDLKLTGGLRWTSDHKHFTDIPSELLVPGYGYPSTAVVNQAWNQWTGRAAANWTPKLDFTDQTLVYGSYAHGYKAGGANPPGAELLKFGTGDLANPIHPLTFKPEFVDAFELGTKNTMLDGSLTLNGDIFYYKYKGYQISRILDRTAINDNFDATVKGAEVEAMWEPVSGLKFNFAGGYEDARVDKGDHSVDLMDRTAGNPDWIVIKPFITQASNCILPKYVLAGMLNTGPVFGPGATGVPVDTVPYSCGNAYNSDLDPVTLLPYVADPVVTCIRSAGPCTHDNYRTPRLYGLRSQSRDRGRSLHRSER